MLTDEQSLMVQDDARPVGHRSTSTYMYNIILYNFRVLNIRVSNRTLIYNVYPEAALT